MTRPVTGRRPPTGRLPTDGRSPAVRAPGVTVREDLATGVDGLYAVGCRPGTDPVRLARAVAADYLDGAGMVVVEAPLCAPPAPGGADDGCDLLWVHRDLAERPPLPGPAVPVAPIGPDRTLADGLVTELAASLALGARYSGLADLLPDDRMLHARVRALLPGRSAGPGCAGTAASRTCSGSG